MPEKNARDNLVLTRFKDQIFEINLNRPEKRNAINLSLMFELEQAVEQAEKMDGARVVLIRGEGAGFSSGIDFTALSEIAEMFGENWRENMLNVTSTFQSVLNQLQNCSLPTIALMHGFALGLGFEIALACDFRIVARHTKIGLPETRLGLIPDVGGTSRLTGLVGPARAKEIIMTGKMIDLESAENWGLLNAVLPIKDLDTRARDLAHEIISSAPLAVSYTKRVVDGMLDLQRGLLLEAWAQNYLIKTDDFMAGIQSMLTKTKPEWQGK